MRLQPSSRDGSVDMVRSVGIIAIVAGHVWGSSFITTIVYPWHVPLFFFLSGWLWKERTLVEEIHSRAKTLIRPYLFWLFAFLTILVADQLKHGAIDFMSLARVIYGGAYATRPFTTF